MFQIVFAQTKHTHTHICFNVFSFQIGNGYGLVSCDEADMPGLILDVETHAGAWIVQDFESAQ